MKRLIVFFAALALLLPGCGLAKTREVPSSTPTITTASSTPTPTEDPVEYEETSEPDTVLYVDPQLSWFSGEVKIRSKECFGSAGCNVSYDIEIGYDALSTLDPSKTYILTYDVIGGEDGPVTDSVEITGEEYTEPYEGHIQTKRRGDKLSVKFTSIEED